MATPAVHADHRRQAVASRPGWGKRAASLRAVSLAPAGIWYLLFFLIPLVWIARISLAVVDNFHLKYAWSLSAYRQLFHDPLVGELLKRSFLLALSVTVITFAIGFPAAWILSRQPPARRNLILVLIIIPWWSSYIVRVFAWQMSFGKQGIINQFLTWTGITNNPLQIFEFGWFGVLIAEVNLYLPLMIIPLYMSLERLDTDLLRAASSLGAKRIRIFRKVVLPLATPGIVAGVIFVFMPMTGEFIAPNLVGGPGQLLYGNQIQSQFGVTFNWPYGSALALILLAMLAVFLVAVRLVGGYAMRNLRQA
jgi:spermidine/putrescine transport system permease protein